MTMSQLTNPTREGYYYGKGRIKQMPNPLEVEKLAVPKGTRGSAVNRDTKNYVKVATFHIDELLNLEKENWSESKKVASHLQNIWNSVDGCTLDKDNQMEVVN